MIRTVAETGSTNADLLLLARSGADDGLWLRAERQTAGRGRQGRAWDSPEGNLYASTLVRLRPGDPPPATLALVAAVTLEEVVRLLLPTPRGLVLKWPNDLLLDGAKLSGILLERADDAIVIGFGVNIAHHPDLPDRVTTSLAEQGVAVTPAEFVTRLAEMFAAWLHHWRHDGLSPIVARWTERAHPPGTPLIARLPDGEAVEGTFDTLAADGALVLRLADGGVRVIHAADVFLV
ncbi:biotin--[acetyl-CoA-carboxylase] ligase [Sphingomonas sp. SUN019]|uniref:biotin--[acetyl-CoA-carboxylase] ligase n=1 Tax=Sphingomonas sp. SUN019 TaxID=2937788 RepID=UPI00216464F3|nr:biotin--[acetyl-CoA-carboxylase] ligase [Sphingomonas sp. SUN019]UVO52565.1 biotin--[acetyl-CoA-carboxylase] ligase [Sphingomonas sp. SUN019]